MEAIRIFVQEYLRWLSLPNMGVVDILEILVIAFATYHIIMWVKNTRAFSLVKGIFVLLVFYAVA